MKIISLGLGVQSTALYFMSSLGKIDRADYAIFSDPGAELPRTYEILELLKRWQKENSGIPIVVVRKNLYKDLINFKNSSGNRWASIPAFSENSGIVRRQCTSEYKIRPIIKKIRQLRGIKKHKHLPLTDLMLGISMDEIERVKESQMSRVNYLYPLIDERINRSDCIAFIQSIGFPVPPKSSCVFCPYHSPSQWRQLKYNDKESWDKVVKVDKAIRNIAGRKLKEKLFLHPSRKPIDEVPLSDQQELFMCEEGFCGV